MSTRVWPLAVIILGTVLPFGWTGVLVLLVFELELIRPWLVLGRSALGSLNHSVPINVSAIAGNRANAYGGNLQNEPNGRRETGKE